MKQKLRVWDSKLLADVYVKVAQLRASIEHIGAQINESDLSNLPGSMIPTELLYQITIAYEFLYDKLLDLDLLDSGNTKQTFKGLN